MKAKSKLLVMSFLVLIIIISAYLLCLKINIKRFESERNVRSTANYIEIEEKVESSTEEVAIALEETIEPVVYLDMTLDDLTNQLNKSLSSNIEGMGYLIASYSLEHNVDPFMATAIMLHETGCRWNCSYIVRECNNVGGQKGSGCGAYGYFNTLEEGIMAFIDNLERNYINYGLTTPELINPKYAEDPNWSVNVNKYIEIIKAQ